jgi:formiminotetrahydrofolate cyclodeaminase
MFAEMRLVDFLEKVAAKTPTPGGGAVSAVVGALGAALGVMAARYSQAPDAEHALDALKGEFLPLAAEDAEAYGRVNQALALPKGTDEEKARRKAALQGALAEAAEVPLKGMAMAVRGLEFLAQLAPRSNKNLTSDLAGAARFLESALAGCAENVEVNAASLADKARRAHLERERSRLEAAARALAERVAVGIDAVHGRS